MSPEMFPDKVEAKCECCGNIWRYHRHDALACPFCNARLEKVDFNFDKTYAFFYGRRWDQIVKDEKEYWERLEAAPSAILKQE